MKVVKAIDSEYLKVTFQPDKCLIDFMLVEVVEVFLRWGTELDKED